MHGIDWVCVCVGTCQDVVRVLFECLSVFKMLNSEVLILLLLFNELYLFVVNMCNTCALYLSHTHSLYF